VAVRWGQGLVLVLALVVGTALPALAAPASVGVQAEVATPSSLHFGAFKNVDPYSQGPVFRYTKAISCPTTSFCMAGDNWGTAIAEVDGIWQIPVRLFPAGRLDGMSCFSATDCVAVGADAAFTYNGHGWSGGTVLVPSGDNLTSVSCPSASLCVAVDDRGRAVVERSGHWGRSALIDGGGGFAQVSCSSTTFCLGLDRRSEFTRWNGRSWTAPVNPDPGGRGLGGEGTSSLSCIGASWCLAVTEESAFIYSDGTWTASPVAMPNGALLVSCASMTWCVVVSPKGQIADWNGTEWQQRYTQSGYSASAVSCPTTSSCTAIDEDGDSHTYDASTSRWTEDTALVDPDSELVAVSCPSTTFCAATGADGSVAVYQEGRWTSLASVDPPRLNPHAARLEEANLESVSCPIAGYCVAVDPGFGQIVTYDHGKWGPPVTVPGTKSLDDSISCSSTSFCVVGTETGHVVVDRSGRWSVETTHLGYSIEVSCTSASFCVDAGLSTNQVSIFDGTSWSAMDAEPTPNTQVGFVWCATSDSCRAVDYGGRVLYFNGRSWTSTGRGVAAGGPRHFSAVTCATATFCLTYAASQFKTLHHRGEWTSATTLPHPNASYPDDGLASISCATPTFCMALDAYNNIAIGR
jgi:hypothetical protein